MLGVVMLWGEESSTMSLLLCDDPDGADMVDWKEGAGKWVNHEAILNIFF